MTFPFLLKNPNADPEIVSSLLPEDKRYLADTDALLTLITMSARVATK